MEDLGIRIPVHHPRTASRLFSGEAVVISPAENMVRMFNTVGSRIWELADGTRTVKDIAVLLVQEYDVNPDEAVAEVQAFVADLVERELLAFHE